MTESTNKSSAEIEREVEESRARVTGTIEALRDQMSPGQIVDQVLSYTRDSGGGEFTRNLGRQVRDNPLPVMLIGAGIGWLMTSGKQGDSTRLGHAPVAADGHRVSGDGYARGTSGNGTSGLHAAKDRAAAGVSGVSQAMGRAKESVTSAFSGASHAASSARDSIRGATTDGSHRASDLRHSAGERMHQASDYTQRNWRWLAEDQPLVLGAVGVALGAMMGMGLPSTRREDELMGATSDQMKSQVRDEASRQYEEVKHTAETAMEEGENEGQSGRTSAQSATAPGHSRADGGAAVGTSSMAGGRGASGAPADKDASPTRSSTQESAPSSATSSTSATRVTEAERGRRTEQSDASTGKTSRWGSTSSILDDGTPRGR